MISPRARDFSIAKADNTGCAILDDLAERLVGAAAVESQLSSDLITDSRIAALIVSNLSRPMNRKRQLGRQPAGWRYSRVFRP